MNQAIIIAVLAVIGGGAVAALITGLFSRPKTKAETNKLVAEAGASIDERWKGWANELEERLKNERQEHGAAIITLTAKVTAMEVTQGANTSTIERLRQALVYEQKVTRLVITWSFVMRDEITRLGGVVPDAPSVVLDYINLLDENPTKQ